MDEFVFFDNRHFLISLMYVRSIHVVAPCHFWTTTKQLQMTPRSTNVICLVLKLRRRHHRRPLMLALLSTHLATAA